MQPGRAFLSNARGNGDLNQLKWGEGRICTSNAHVLSCQSWRVILF